MGARGGRIANRSRSWSLWERSPNPTPIRIQPRDVRILRLVFEHRFLQPAHLHALLPESSPDGLNRRLRLLWQNRYLERPRAIRPTKILTEELVYGLGKKGAQLLETHDEALKGIGALDWTETPKKQVGLPYVDHQLGIATFMVCVRIAAERAGAELRWDGHFHREQWKFPVPGESHSRMPDAYFALRVPEKGVAHHYLEVDRGTIRPARMQERYDDYFRFWHAGTDERSFKNFRVLTVTETPERMDVLRQAALPIGRAPKGRTWAALMFTDMTRFGLENPEQVLGASWLLADSQERAALL